MGLEVSELTPLKNQVCTIERVAAYVEDELDPGARLELEEHMRGCALCQQELAYQRRFMCELEAVLANESHQLEVPGDFARIVAARAESDMSGARSKTERKRALQLCLALAIGSFALLGAASSRMVLSGASVVLTKIVAVFGLVGRAVYDAAVGAGIILRATAKALMPDAFSMLVLLLLLLALLILSVLISGYHRYHHRGLYE